MMHSTAPFLAKWQFETSYFYAQITMINLKFMFTTHDMALRNFQIATKGRREIVHGRIQLISFWIHLEDLQKI